MFTNTLRGSHVAATLLILVGLVSCSLGAQPAEKPFPASWKVGDNWIIEVDKEGEASKDRKTVLRIALLSIEKGPSNRNAELLWLPDIKGSGSSINSYLVYLDLETGWMRRVLRIEDKAHPEKLQGKEDGVFPGAIPNGFPVECFPLEPFEAQEGGPFSVTLTKFAVNELEMEACYVVDGKNVVIKQRWIEGETWWREYERYVDKKLDLRAKLLTPKAYLAGKMKDADTRLAAYPLRQDPKLQVKISIDLTDPKVAELHEILAKASGLEIAVADNLQSHQPKYGKITLNNTRIFALMELMAQKGLQNGRWEKTETGYRLEGGSETPLPPRKFDWFWPALASALLLAALGGFVIYRRRGKKAPAVPSSP